MNSSSVTTEGLVGARPGREALPGGTRLAVGRVRAPRGGGSNARKRRRRDDESMVGEAEFGSYYGRPVIKKPVWEAREIAGYFFLGGLAGASSLVAAGAELSGRPVLARGAKLGAAGAISLSLGALVKDLGRPARFLNMLRVFKPTSPMSVGTWVVSAYAPAAIVAAGAELTGALPLVGSLATSAAALLGPAVASYTGVLIANTAVPAWHDAHREMPFVFAGSALAASAGLGLVVSGPGESAPVARLAVAGAVAELVGGWLLTRRLDDVVARAYEEGRPAVWLRTSKALALAGGAGVLVGSLSPRSRPWHAASGVALLGASACTRFGVFAAGMASAADPAATIVPQRERVEQRKAALATV